MQKVIEKSKDDIRFIFKNGFEVERAEMLGCFFSGKITVIMIEYFVV